MFDVYILLLIASIAVLAQCSAFLYLSRAGLWLGMAKLEISEERRIMIHSLNNSSVIFTSVFLGVAFLEVDLTINSVPKAMFLMALLIWLANSLLWQRVPAASIELAQDRAGGRRLALQLTLIICWVYFPWFLMWRFNKDFSMIGIVLFVDLALQLYIRALLRQEQRKSPGVASASSSGPKPSGSIRTVP